MLVGVVVSEINISEMDTIGIHLEYNADSTDTNTVQRSDCLQFFKIETLEITYVDLQENRKHLLSVLRIKLREKFIELLH